MVLITNIARVGGYFTNTKLIVRRLTRQAEVVTSKQVKHILLNHSKAHKPAPDHPRVYGPRYFILAN